MGVTISAVSKWENGKNYPDVVTLRKIAEILDVSCDLLMHPERGLKDNGIPEEETEPIAQESVKPNKRFLKIASLVACLLVIAGIFLIKFFTGEEIEFIQARDNVENVYGMAYEMAFLEKGHWTDEDRVRHADVIYEQWIAGAYNNDAKTVLVILYYDSKEDALNWENTDHKISFFDWGE